MHRPRLERAAQLVLEARSYTWAGETGERRIKVVDLGCGDGGLIAHLRNEYGGTLNVLGYDFQPSNGQGWLDRGLEGIAHHLDFVKWWAAVPRADAYVITEVLEHMTDPHGMLKRIRLRGAQLICSSPHDENYQSHDECHCWAWDTEGYAAMIEAADFRIRTHETIGRFQVVWAVPT